MYLIVVLYALLALTFTLGKISVTAAQPLFFISIRMLMAGTLLISTYLIYTLLRNGRRRSSSLNWPAVIDFMQVALFHVFFAFTLEFWALQYVSSIKANLIFSLTPFISMILSYLFYRERVTGPQLIGALIAFMCLVPLMVHGSLLCLTTLFSCSVPELALFGAVLSATYAWFVIKRLMTRGYPLLMINGVGMLAGGVLSLIAWLEVRSPEMPAVMAWQPFMYTLIGLILLSNIIVYNLYGWLLKHYSINLLTVFGFLSPLFGAFYGVVFLGEYVGWEHVLALGGITVGLALFTLKRTRVEE